MNKFTVNDAIVAVLKETNKSMTAKELYSKIIERKYYEFKTDNPTTIIATTLRRHSTGHSHSGIKLYRKKEGGNLRTFD